MNEMNEKRNKDNGVFTSQEVKAKTPVVNFQFPGEARLGSPTKVNRNCTARVDG